MTRQLQIFITADAEQDLQEIYDQRLRHRGQMGSDGANALLDTLYDAIAGLADFPLRGPPPLELDAIGISDWRQLSIWPFRIIYTIERNVLTVAVIADSRRDFTSLLERRLLTRPPRG